MSFPATNRPRDGECPHGAPGLQQEDQAMKSTARRMFELLEPIGVIPYSADEPNKAMFALRPDPPTHRTTVGMISAP
jgi:hypothetical protein